MSNIRAANKSRRQRPFGLSVPLLQWGIPTIVVFLTMAAFYPLLQNQFVNWDDYKNIVENPAYRGLGWKNIHWMFTTFHMGHYQPLSWMTLGMDYILWGMNPFGYHLTNLILHGANALVFYYVSLRLLSLIDATSLIRKTHTLRVAAGLSALLFAVHPLRVESVAWVTERRDVLSGFFFLLTILYYLKAVTVREADSGRGRWMAISLISYVLSLLSKASGITLPFVLVVLDIYPLRRLGENPKGWFASESFKVWREKMPFFVFALGAGTVALLAQHQAKAARSLEQYDTVSRIMQSLYGAGFYLWKTVLPLNLSPLYEIPLTPDPWRWSFLLSGLVVIGVTSALFVYRKHCPAIFACWIVYVILFLPTSGIAQSGPQLVADRYSYFSCMVWAVVAGGVIDRLWQRGQARSVSPLLSTSITVCFGLALVGLGAMTWRQAQVWHDSEGLWRHALSIDGQSSFAHNNLGNALADQGRLEEAIDQFQKALQLNPEDADAVYNLGNAWARQGNFEAAAKQLQQALQMNPDNAMAAYDLGNVRARQGRLEEAMGEFEIALRIDPRLAKAHYNLGSLLTKQGKSDEAVEQYQKALEIDASYVRAYYGLGTVLTTQGQLDRAIDSFQAGLRIQPNVPELHDGLARALVLQGRKEEALQHYQEALRLLKPRS
jgi:tetratricopeptide (TPR) repeat protein